MACPCVLWLPAGSASMAIGLWCHEKLPGVKNASYLRALRCFSNNRFKIKLKGSIEKLLVDKKYRSNLSLLSPSCSPFVPLEFPFPATPYHSQRGAGFHACRFARYVSIARNAGEIVSL